MIKPSTSVANVAARYKTVQTTTASPTQLVVMLYDGILRFAREAEESFARKDRARVGDRIGRGQAVIDELIMTLDETHAPELAENLVALYGFCKRRFFEANLRNDPRALKDIIDTLTPIRDAWATIASSKG
jgi:flagellar protein FliS